jgi:hypothetical protein
MAMDAPMQAYREELRRQIRFVRENPSTFPKLVLTADGVEDLLDQINDLEYMCDLFANALAAKEK